MLKHQYIKDKNFLLFFTGALVSGIGSRIYGFGISLYLLDLTGLATSMSTYIAIWTFVVFIVSPVAATFTDRWKNKVRVLYMTDYGRGIVYFLSGVGVWYFNNLGNTDMVLLTIYTLLVIIALQTAFFSPASSALLPQLVDEEELVSASSLFQLTRSAQNILGMAIGAFLYVEFGIVILIIINAISFILSGFSEMFIRYETAKNQEKLNQSAYEEVVVEKKDRFKHYSKQVISDLKESILYIFKKANPIRSIVIIIVLSLLLVEPYFSVGVPYLIKEYLTFMKLLPDYILAISNSANSIGLIVMSIIIATYIGTKLTIHQLLKIAGMTYILIVIGYYLAIRTFDDSIINETTFLFIFVGTNFVAGLMQALINAPVNAAISKYVDPNKIGKVVTVMDSFGGIIMPLSLLAAGLVIDHLSVYYVMYAMMAGMVIMTFIIFKDKQLGHLK
jgi:hypothetical protein